MEQFWRGILAFIGVWTGDGRRIDALTWRDTPLTIRFQREDNGGHSNAIPAGRIDRVWIEGSQVMGEGVFSASEDGMYAASVVGDGSMRGVSIDPGAVEQVDIVIAADGTEIPFEEWLMYPAGMEPWPGPFEFATIYTAYEMAAATLVATPAFAGVGLELIDPPAPVVTPPATVPAATPAAATPVASIAPPAVGASMVLGGSRPAVKPTPLVPVGAEHARLLSSAAFRPPRGAFEKQALTRYTPFAIDPDTGVMSGHAYPWEGVHRGYASAMGTTVKPPTSADFSQFLTGGSVTADDGSTFHVGVITYLGGHKLTGAEYDLAREDPANQLGPVTVYADEFGVQACGIVWPDVDPVKVSRAMAAFPSGDWRMVRGEKLLCGLAMVNNPGYTAFEQEGVDIVRLVASFSRKPAPTDAPPRRLSADGLAALAALDSWADRRL